MPSREQLSKRRETEAARAWDRAAAVVRGLQDVAYGLVLDWLAGRVEVDDNRRIKYTVRNFAALQGLRRVLDMFQRKYQKTVLGSVLEGAADIFGLNEEYFQTFTAPAENVFDIARRKTLLRWGYDVEKGELIAGGYFEALFSSADVSRRVAGLVNRAIAAKMPLADFQKAFRGVFVGRAGQGMLERHFETNSFDLFQRIDRTANLVYADRLGLNYAVYSGTLKDNSRPFCVERVNKVYSRAEIQGWEKLQFQGKPKIGYDPFTDCGGFNCRHHLSFVSDEIAAHLRPDIKENAKS